ncbi:hypothetical protein LOZ53_003709 [Ophidiomyces ophidiicola]|nr:hypothetical protein LOZ55_004484 [Ophidiomyces ophidiicola]KAI1986861.1 hypothetical protein LOZ54_003750 [Ophidiomyces ophidiicola]KAI1989128.1 hypothetical protein LOZ53_003709 [Ophidiomyces ophidiicola]KAI2002947.1 hypothetical protein LOZ51_000019 [Ophidiomyces ophidiicola]
MGLLHAAPAPPDADRAGRPSTAEKATASHESQPGPAGGFDETPFPDAPPGFTLRVTIHRAYHLPMGDFGTMSSDPYVVMILDTDLPRRHKQDPDMTFRTPTIQRNINPEWNCEWIVANVPASGFRLKCRVYDEDTADRDDRLGTAYVNVSKIDEQWTDIKEQSFRIRKKTASNRAYLLRSIAATCSRNISVKGELVVSVECLGKTPGEEGGQLYTVGPNYWTRHFSPMIGRLVGTKDSVQSEAGKRPVSRYNFQAIQIQLTGPVPSKLYHRYVEFRPFVAGMFNGQSIRGRLLNHTLHHQHSRIYAFDRSTMYGSFDTPCVELARKFLEFVHYDQGGRIFTYVLTLDGQWRFTETGKEFGIDLLSKHTMHSNVSIYVAYSGEFFVRRICSHQQPHHQQDEKTDNLVTSDEAHARSESTANGNGAEQLVVISTNPADYELVIDNDSGTYRPNAALLPLLKEFLEKNLPCLNIMTLDCQKDAEKMGKLKDEQRERKKEAGRHITYLQRRASSAASSISSSDEENLERRAGQSQQHKKRHPLAQVLHHANHPKSAYKQWLDTGHVRPISVADNQPRPAAASSLLALPQDTPPSQRPQSARL